MSETVEGGRAARRKAAKRGGQGDGGAKGSSGKGSGDKGSGGNEGVTLGKGLREVALLLLLAVVLSVLVRTFLVQSFYIPSGSMLPTLQLSDRVIASKINVTLSGVDRGEIVVFRDPDDWLADAPTNTSGVSGKFREALTFVGVLPSDSGDDLIKRVIGVGGDRVQCCDDQGRVLVNGVPLDEPYVDGKAGDSAGGQCLITFDVTVPEGHLWVMGDNRGGSADSRCHTDDRNGGYVPEEQVIGRAVATVWPLSRWEWHGVPSTFSQDGISGAK